MKKICEFCGKKKETATTSFNGAYCKECYALVIKQSEEAIDIIKMMED